MRHLPTAGGGPALTAILGNNSQVLVSSIAAANAQMKAGKLRAARVLRRAARAGAARRADDEGARLRRRVLPVGRPVRAQGHAAPVITMLRDASKKAAAAERVQGAR